MFECFCIQHCRADGWVGVISPRQLLLVCSYEKLLGQVWGWCTLEYGLNPPVANCLPFQGSNPSGSHFRCLWRLFWNWLLSNHAFFSSLLFGYVGSLCLLDVAIPHMHFFYFFIETESWKRHTRNSPIQKPSQNVVRTRVYKSYNIIMTTSKKSSFMDNKYWEFNIEPCKNYLNFVANIKMVNQTLTQTITI
jgi:hypothetical protein